MEISEPMLIGYNAEIAIQVATVENMQAITDAFKLAAKEGRLNIQVVSAPGKPPVIQATVAAEIRKSQRICPSCHKRLVRDGVLAQLGEAGTMVETCLQCASVSKATDSIFRLDPMRERIDD